MEVPASDHDEDDEMEMSDDERDRDRSPMKSGGPSSSKRAKLDNDSLKVNILVILIRTCRFPT